MYDVSENTTPANIVKLLSWISFVHSYNTLTSTSEHFHTKESAQWQTKCFSHVLGSKFGTGYLKFLKKKKKKKAFKRKLQHWRWHDYCENEKVILLSFIFIVLSFFPLLVSLA